MNLEAYMKLEPVHSIKITRDGARFRMRCTAFRGDEHALQGIEAEADLYMTKDMLALVVASALVELGGVEFAKTLQQKLDMS